MARQIDMGRIIHIFDNEYDFKICEKDEIEDVLEFYVKYWNKNHVIIKSKELLNWMYYDKVNECYNFAFARHKVSREIHACTAFVYSDHFDCEIQTPIRWCGMTKSHPDYNYLGIGVILLEKLQLLKPAIESAALGLSLDSRNLSRYDKRGKQEAPASHYFLVNIEKSEFNIAFDGGDRTWYSEVFDDEHKRILKVDISDYEKLDVISLDAIPIYKSKEYYINRFFKHPIYRYSAGAIYENDDLQAIFFWRKIFVHKSCCLRIVDYFGAEGALNGTKACFEKLLIEEDAEYIDFLFAGLSLEEVEAAGFVDRRKNKKWIIPDHFEPFERVNTDVYFTPPIESAGVKLTIFKGDSDQDRPNVIS